MTSPEKRDARDRRESILTIVTLVVVLVMAGLYVGDRIGDVRAEQAEACQRGEALRAYVRLDNDLTTRALSATTGLDQPFVDLQLAARKALFASGAFDKDQC